MTTTPWYAPLGGPLGSNVTAEIESQFRMGVAGRIERPGFMTALPGGVSRRVTARVNGVDRLAHIAPDGITGPLFGITGQAAVAAGDLVALKMDAAGDEGRATNALAIFRAAVGHAYLLQASSVNGLALGVSSARTFSVHGTTLAHANASSNGRMVMRAAGTAKAPFVQVISNARTADVVLTLAVNNVDTAVTVTVPAGATGLFAGTGEAAFVAGDDLAWRVTGSDSATIVFGSFGLTVVGAAPGLSDIFSRPTGTVNRSASATPSYVAINGQMLPGVNEDQRQVALGFPARLTKLRAQVTAAAYTATLTLRVNGVGVLSIPIPSGSSGLFEADGPVSVNSSDKVSVEITGTGSGNVTFAWLGLTVEDVTPPFRPRAAWMSGD